MSKPVLYTRRWFILLSFCTVSFSNAFLWLAYSTITTTVTKYWHTETLVVNGLSMIYMFYYIPLVLPASFVLDTNLRRGILLGAGFTAAGSVVRACGFSRNLFGLFLQLIGQSMASIGQAFILSAAPAIAYAWFDVDETSTAISLGVTFNQLGSAAAFFLCPFIASQAGIPFLLTTQALLCSLSFLLVFLFFTSKPPTPPTTLVKENRKSIVAGLKILIARPHFILLSILFGYGLGLFYAISTLLDEFTYPSGFSQYEAGIFGFLMVIAGLVGAISFGKIGDKTKQFKILILISFFGSGASFIFFTLVLMYMPNFIAASIACSLIGFFLTAMIPCSLEAGVECASPVGEATATGVMMMIAQVFGIVLTLCGGILQSVVHVQPLLITSAVGLIGSGVVLLFFLRVASHAEITNIEVK